MDRGWSLKDVHRLIVHSATYRQSSQVTPELLARDPYNRLLARGPRFRVEGEIVRDIALAASGLLNPKGGRAEHLSRRFPNACSAAVELCPVDLERRDGPDRYRRALYTFRRRSLPYPVLQNFDTPNGDFSCVRRAALEHAAAGADHAQRSDLHRMRAGPGAHDALDRPAPERRGAGGVRLPPRASAGRPTEAESKALVELLEQERSDGSPRAGPTHARSPPARTNCPPKLPAGVTPAQLAAYTVVARVLLNLDETITKE